MCQRCFARWRIAPHPTPRHTLGWRRCLDGRISVGCPQYHAGAAHGGPSSRAAGCAPGVLRTPSALSESGCSHAVRLRAQTAAQAQALLAAEKLTPQRVYVRTAEGYEEMGG